MTIPNKALLHRSAVLTNKRMIPSTLTTLQFAVRRVEERSLMDSFCPGSGKSLITKSGLVPVLRKLVMVCGGFHVVLTNMHT